MRILCVCLKGEHRSKYLAAYLVKKGHEATFGGVHHQAARRITQADVDHAQVIIIAREYIRKRFEKKYATKGKKIVTLEVSDFPPELGEKAVKIHRRSETEFQNRYVRPKLRAQLKRKMPHL